MKSDYKLSDLEKKEFMTVLNRELAKTECKASLEGPLELYSAVRGNGIEEKWIENIYDIKIVGGLGDFKAYCTFDMVTNINEQIKNKSKNVLYQLWNEKDKNFNSPLAEIIWGK